MDDLLNEFLTETGEGLAMLDVELVKLEKDPNDHDLLGNIFRLVHTIKGTCGFLGLTRLEGVAHAGENVLGKIRDGDLVATSETVSLILECLDRIRVILTGLEQTDAEPEGDDSDLIRRLNTLADGGEVELASTTPATVSELSEVSDLEVTFAPETTDSGFPPADEPAPAEHEVVALEIESPATDALAPAEVEPEPDAASLESMRAERREPTEIHQAPEPEIVAEVEAAQEPNSTDTGGSIAESSLANQSIRVNVGLLENLMTMVSELVLTRNQLLQILRNQTESEFATPLHGLNHVVSELQDGVMRTRMQPIGNAWAKLPRIVRDLSLELGKKIEIIMKGADTELDRQVLELIKDPLTHMVRNAADHGLEPSEERLEAGKPEVGKIRVTAHHEGGHIIIEISDDGRGLSVEKIKEKVIRNGLANEADLDSMTEQQIQKFIFKAGFSTATRVTAVSGRGVGMDVVKTNIEKIGGTVELSSVKGRGSTFKIKIPLTLAIVSALIVECGGERFAIPQISVLELVRASANSETKIEHIKNTPVLRLRNRLLPLVNLRELLKINDTRDRDEGLADGSIEPGAAPPEHGSSQLADGDHFVVVTQVGIYTFGIIVDRVFDTEEIVVKPVARILRDIQMFSGNTILGDGRVVMILDPNGIAAATGEVQFAEDTEAEDSEQQVWDGEDKQAMLVFHSIDESPKAVSLNLVARLEEIDLSSIEESNDQRVVQYRGHLMPLVSMEGAPELRSEGRQPIIVFSDQSHTMGLAVDRIIDIVEDTVNVELNTNRAGYIGSAVIDGKATDIVDVGFYLGYAFKDWFGNETKESFTRQTSNRILLVDDSPFFRNMLSPLLSVAGYRVTSVESADAALSLCEAGEDFDLIISDIEMPGMTGFEFAETVKNDTRWSDIPMVALSSYSTPSDLARGREAGFRDYVAKNDREALLSTLQDTLADVRDAA